MPPTSMNLVSSPWIPVINTSGSTELISIRTALNHAGDYLDVAAELPSMDFGIRRILLAILYRATIEQLDEGDPFEIWKSWWIAGEFPSDSINAYLDTWEHRFDLFDETTPFLQTPSLHTQKGDWKDLGVLISDSPGAGALYNQLDPDAPVDPATAARWLIHANAFDYSGIKSGAVGDKRVKGGKGYPMGIGWSGWLGCTTIKGQNLFETLALNFVANRELDDDTFEKDLPIWEEKPLTSSARPEARAWGQVSLITWPQRRIRLKEEHGLVTGVLICNGDPVDYTNQRGNEYMSPWRYSKPQSSKAKQPIYMPSGLQPGRAMWRGIETLLPPSSENMVKAPDKQSVHASYPATTVEWIGELTTRRILPTTFQMNLEVTSVIYGTQSAVIDQVIQDSLTFPALLATTEGEQLRAIVATAVQRADIAANALAKFAGNLARAEGGEPATATESTRKSVFSLIDPLFRDWLSRLTISEKEAEVELQQWTDQLRYLVKDEGATLVQRTSPAAWTGREIDDRLYTVGQAEAWFFVEINKSLPKPKGDPQQ